MPIDYTNTAELYADRYHGPKKPIFYRRFDSVAEALQFAVENLPAGLTKVRIETEDERLEGATIDELYAAEGYPLLRQAKPAGAL
jgi:hypothetical protein